MKILVVEDDPRISDVLEYALKTEGYEVVKAQRGREAIEIAQRSAPALIVLDVGLPDIDGFEVCRSIRKCSDVPVIFLTSRSDEVDRVHGLELGGDDYVVKPFSPREVMARVRAILRRGEAARRPAAIVDIDPGVSVDLDRRQAWRHGEPVALATREFDLLAFLARN